MNQKTQISDNLNNINEQLNHRDEISLSNNIKSIYHPPSIHLLGEVLNITAGGVNGDKFDVFSNQENDAS